MTDTTRQSEKPTVASRLRKLAKDIEAFVRNAPEGDQQTVLSLVQDRQLQDLLKDWQRGDQREASGQPTSSALTDPKEDRVLRDFIGDIGTGGMFIEIPPTYSVGEEITLVFSPSYEEGPIKVTGRIVWRIPKGIGIRFTSATNDLEDILKSL